MDRRGFLKLLGFAPVLPVAVAGATARPRWTWHLRPGRRIVGAAQREDGTWIVVDSVGSVAVSEDGVTWTSTRR